MRELLTKYFDTSRETIERHGGIVEKFVGDAVMAVWGTPVAHEDDAERAVRTALELVDAVEALGHQVGIGSWIVWGGPRNANGSGAPRPCLGSSVALERAAIPGSSSSIAGCVSSAIR